MSGLSCLREQRSIALFQLCRGDETMRVALIEAGHRDAELKASPIVPSWIIEGSPEARACVVSTSKCGSAWTMVWSCTEGKFHWYYDVDETIMILEGSIVLESEEGPPKRYGAGDIILFRDGAHAIWRVDGYVKKIAFFRRAFPWGFNFPVRAANKLKRMIRPRPSPLAP
jgi:uncharacterized protein